MALGREVGLGPCNIVRWGPSSSFPKMSRDPQFSAHAYCGQKAGCIKMPLDVELGLGPGHIVLDGDPTPPKTGQSPHFSADVCCGQTFESIKMPLGTEVGLGPGHIVLDADPAPPSPNGNIPQFRTMSVGAKRLDDLEATWYEGRLQPRPHCVTWRPLSPPKKEEAQPPPNFRPMSIVGKRSPISFTAEHLTARLLVRSKE